MKSNIIEEYLEEFQQYPNLCNWSKLQSVLIWNKVAFCRAVAQFNLNETSITQELIYEFWKVAHVNVIPIRIYQAVDEKTNGNDFEICIQTEKGYILMPCQAKIIKLNSRYPTLNHKGKSGRQIDLLIEYAKAGNGFPIYFFYNSCFDHETIRQMEDVYVFDLQELGCSVHSAQKLKKRYFDLAQDRFTSPTFLDLHYPTATPLSSLFCTIGKPFAFLAQILGIDQQDIGFYSEDALTNKAFWKNMVPPVTIGRISPPEEKVQFKREVDDTGSFYKPRFRILFPLERKRSSVFED